MRHLKSRFTAVFAVMSMTALYPLNAADKAQVASPDGTITVVADTTGDARPAYRILRNGKEIVGQSRLGFLFTDQNAFDRNVEIADQKTSSVDETWAEPWGEWKSIRNNYNELLVTFRERTPTKREMRVRFRVYDDGVGFRMEFPEQPNFKTANIAEELTQFNISRPGQAWWTTATEYNREEYPYNATKISEVGLSMTPMTVKLDDGTHIALHEAALVDYSTMNLQKVQDSLFKAVLIPSGRSAAKVVRDLPFHTPWRTLQIADSAPALYHSSKLILNLNEPNKLGDVSWVKPRKYMGIWWGMHLDSQSWESGPKHGATTENAKKLIDFASKHGFTGILVEGWNKGWDGDWVANGESFNFTEAYPDFDIKAVTDYGKNKGVVLIGHNETSAFATNYEKQMDDAFKLYRSLGMDTVKSGYVADAGGFKIRDANGKQIYTWHESQDAVNHHMRVVESAAKHKIAMNPHEPVKDTGLRRTYPNWVSREGQRGMEYNAWGQPKNAPDYDSTLVFTRMLSGPMDFTPGVLSLKGKGNTDILSTEAKQLAYYVVVYSPIRMAADLAENYEKHMPAFQFIKDVAVDWTDTRVLAGEVGDYVAIARKAKGTGEWFLGAMGDEQAREINVKLDFLEPGKSYTAEIYRDGDDADYRTEKRHSMVIEKRKVTPGENMLLKIAPGGGQAIRFVAGK